MLESFGQAFSKACRVREDLAKSAFLLLAFLCAYFAQRKAANDLVRVTFNKAFRPLRRATTTPRGGPAVAFRKSDAKTFNLTPR